MQTELNTAVKAPEGGTDHRCPYCREFITFQPAADYAPVYNYCTACGKRFIVERLRNRIDAMRLEDAPCASDPECRIIEMGQGDEE
jgi:hypothetical protein